MDNSPTFVSGSTSETIQVNLLRRRSNEIPRILLNLHNARNQVHLFGFQKLGLVEELPTEIQNWEESNHSIRKEECRDGPITRQKDGITADKGHDGSADTSDVGDIRLEPTSVGEGVSGYPLGVEGLLEADEGECHDREVDELRGRYLDMGLSTILFI